MIWILDDGMVWDPILAAQLTEVLLEVIQCWCYRSLGLALLLV